MENSSYRKIKFVDRNKSLVDMVSILGIESICGDYFIEAYKTEQPVLMTASNPFWGFGGGIDGMFMKHFPELCRYKQIKGGGNERIANICFTITVDENLIATEKEVLSAIQFALSHVGQDETLILMGSGTGIGMLSPNQYVECLKKLL